jgi:hypothetical protein
MLANAGTATVARVCGRVGLDLVVGDASDDAGGDGSFEPVRASD